MERGHPCPQERKITQNARYQRFFASKRRVADKGVRVPLFVHVNNVSNLISFIENTSFIA